MTAAAGITHSPFRIMILIFAPPSTLPGHLSSMRIEESLMQTRFSYTPPLRTTIPTRDRRNVPVFTHMPRTGSSVAGLTRDVAVPGWPAASRQPRTLLAGVVAAQKPVAERNPYLRSPREEPPLCAQFSGV
jgi:hypothetical protein